MDRIFKKILITGTEIHIYKYKKKKRNTREDFGELENKR